jgi:hypothetical protein
MIAFLKKFVNSTIGTANMKPLDQLITSGSAPVLSVVTPTAPSLANSQVFAASGTFTAPKTGMFYVTLVGRGGDGGDGGNYAQYYPYYNSGGTGGNGGGGFIKFRAPVAMTAGQQTAATIGASTTFGGMTVANGTKGGNGGNASSYSGGAGGYGGGGAVPGSGGYGGSGHGDNPDGGNGVVSASLFPPFQYILSSDAQRVVSVFGVPEIVTPYITNGGYGGGGAYNPDYTPGTGSPGKPGVVIIEWN